MQHSGPATYRPDIDGMRAVAVLSVVLFHIKKTLVPGGYAGVDIFFVISGYLITLLIYGQMRSGTFSFADFYQRRINRIAPALFALMAGVMLVGLVLLSPLDLIRLVKSAAYTCFGISNVFFWREYGNYFSSGIDEAPLLHTWSLAVEEQFYLIWPFLLLVIARLRSGRKHVLLGVGLVAAVMFSEFGVRNVASASYYLLPMRFFEMLAGGFLAILVHDRQKGLEAKAANAVGLLGVVLTFGSLFLLDEKSSFPGLNALYPCLGTACLIASGTNKKSWTYRGLSTGPLVFIGLISYSLYLWHWPIIAFVHYLDIDIGVVTGTTIFLASLLLGWASWKYVETPFRRSGGVKSLRSVVSVRFAAPVAVVFLALFVVTQNSGLPGRFDPRIPAYEKIIATAPNEIRSKCHSSTFYYDRQPSSSCILGVNDHAPSILLIGDSFANHFTGMIDILAKSDKVAVTDYTMDGCAPVKGMGFGEVPSYAAKCKARNDFNYKLVSEGKYKYVILAGKWPNDGEKEYFDKLESGLRNSITAILASGAKPIIILNNEGTKNANCPVRRLLSGSAETCDKTQVSRQKQNEMFSSLSQKFPELTFIDPNKAMCEKGICHAMIDGVPLYRDPEHLNDAGSRVIGNALLKQDIHLVAPNIVLSGLYR